MPLVVLCGPPCSGKTRRAQALAEAARRRGVDSVELVNEESLKISRTQAYASANAEKDARSLFRATVQRLLSTRTLVLADSLNLFKSMRYELYCRAREVATSSCVVFCDTPAERCREWNAAREPELRYEEKALEDLISRMEPPDAARRWDYPLFVATPDAPLPVDEVLDSVLKAQALRPSVATVSQQLGDAQELFELDGVTQEVVAAIIERGKDKMTGDEIAVPHTAVKYRVQGSVQAAELRSQRRQFLKISRGAPRSSKEQFARAFVEYLNGAAASSPASMPPAAAAAAAAAAAPAPAAAAAAARP